MSAIVVGGQSECVNSLIGSILQFDTLCLDTNDCKSHDTKIITVPENFELSIRTKYYKANLHIIPIELSFINDETCLNSINHLTSTALPRMVEGFILVETDDNVSLELIHITLSLN